MTKISELESIEAADLDDAIVVVQGGVTKRATVQDYVDVMRGYWMQADTIPAGETVTIPAGYQMIVYGDFTVDGDLVAIGDLVIL